MTVYLNTRDAAGVLGVRTAIAASKILRERGVPNQTQYGERNSYTAADVVRVTAERRAEALGRNGGDELNYARAVARRLSPPGPAMVLLSDGRREVRNPDEAFEAMNAKRGAAALTMLGADPAMVFGPGVVEAAVADVARGTCRTCLAFALTPWGALKPEKGTAAVLLGKPCLGCLTKMTPRPPAARPVPTHRPAVAASARTSVPGGEAARYREAARQFRAKGDETLACHLESRARTFGQGGAR
jgi:hypothetical protein